jgi:hypothetical protein
VGYKRTKTYVLTFADEQFAGLEVRARGASIQHVIGLVGLMDLAGLKDITKITPQDRRELDRLFRIFVGCPKACDWAHEDQGGNHYVSKIKSWNLEDEDDIAVPATYEGYVELDMEFQMALVFTWLEAVVGVGGGDLGKDSPGGGLPPGDSIPMETLPDDPES